MAPSPKESDLEKLLVSGLTNFPSTRHLLMQLSLAAYLEKKVKLEDVEMEYPLKYRGPKDLYGSKIEQNSGKVIEWPVDLAMTYYEGKNKVCEFIEVETVWLPNVRRRGKNIWLKARKVDTILHNREYNEILRGVDIVRFSVAMNANYIMERGDAILVNDFVRWFSKKLRYDYKAEDYKVYLLKDDKFYADAENRTALNGFMKRKKHDEIREYEYPALKAALIKAYSAMRRDDEIGRFYKEYPL
ncbi:MAG: hypothetical protein M1433_02830 [Candidatus Parvarchaeota archaeon]|nr:hypothetical protein [Candidatus Parvarchaeota archaeon]